MSDPKKRRLFQIHLSTCIVLMFVAGGLLWLNVAPHRILYAVYVTGFPLWSWYSHEIMAGDDSKQNTVIEPGVHLWPALFDAFCAILVLIMAASVLESRLQKEPRP
ncbi:MAG TPA: hypothetical protein VGP72_23880 [Planctomycetota bacterium]|jgi:hypothetical protein